MGASHFGERILGLTVLVGLGLFLSMDLYRSHSIQADESMVVSLLHKARTRSLSNINESTHGVKVDGDDIILFQGSSYATRDTSFDESFPLDGDVSITWPDSEVVFNQLSGNIDTPPGDMTINSQGKTSVISFNAQGRIDY